MWAGEVETSLVIRSTKPQMACERPPSLIGQEASSATP